MATTYLSDVSDDLLGRGVPHGIVEAADADPEAVESVIGAVDGQHGRSGVRFGHATIPLQHDEFGPNLIVDRLPFAHHLLYVVLK